MLAFPPEEHAKLRFVRHLSMEKKIVIKQKNRHKHNCLFLNMHLIETNKRLGKRFTRQSRLVEWVLFKGCFLLATNHVHKGITKRLV